MDYKFLSFINDIRSIPKGIDIWGYKEAMIAAIRAKYSIDDFIYYERMIDHMFQHLRAKLIVPFIQKYGWLVNEIYKLHGQDHAVIDPVDVLNLSYLRFLHLYDDLHNNYLDHKIKTDYTDKYTVKEAIKEIDKLSSSFVADNKAINITPHLGTEANDPSTYFNNLVMYIVLHPDLYQEITERINKNKFPLKHTIYYALPHYINLFYPFPNIKIGEPYPDYYIAQDNIKRVYYHDRIRPATIIYYP
jgi:hypothetical protein